MFRLQCIIESTYITLTIFAKLFLSTRCDKCDPHIDWNMNPVQELRDQGLTEIPSNINQNARELHLQSNEISSLGEKVFYNKHNSNMEARVVLLSCNKITSVDQLAFFGFEFLMILEIKYNLITVVPDLSVVSAYFEALALDYNPIASITNAELMRKYYKI